MKKNSHRHEVRKKVLQILYAYELNSEGLEALIDGVFSDVKTDSLKLFGRELITKTLSNKKMLDEEISSRVENWELNRLALIDKLILRMGICELLFFVDIPPKASINEAIEVSKIFGASGSGKFINGILDRVLSDLKKENKLNKTGRGLVNESFTEEEE